MHSLLAGQDEEKEGGGGEGEEEEEEEEGANRRGQGRGKEGGQKRGGGEAEARRNGETLREGREGSKWAGGRGAREWCPEAGSMWLPLLLPLCQTAQPASPRGGLSREGERKMNVLPVSHCALRVWKPVQGRKGLVVGGGT